MALAPDLSTALCFACTSFCMATRSSTAHRFFCDGCGAPPFCVRPPWFLVPPPELLPRPSSCCSSFSDPCSCCHPLSSKPGPIPVSPVASSAQQPVASPCRAHRSQASQRVPPHCCAEELRAAVEGGIRAEVPPGACVCRRCWSHQECGNRAVCGEMSRCSCLVPSAEAPGWAVVYDAAGLEV